MSCHTFHIIIHLNMKRFIFDLTYLIINNLYYIILENITDRNTEILLANYCEVGENRIYEYSTDKMQYKVK